MSDSDTHDIETRRIIYKGKFVTYAENSYMENYLKGKAAGEFPERTREESISIAVDWFLNNKLIPPNDLKAMMEKRDNERPQIERDTKESIQQLKLEKEARKQAAIDKAAVHQEEIKQAEIEYEDAKQSVNEQEEQEAIEQELENALEQARQNAIKQVEIEYEEVKPVEKTLLSAVHNSVVSFSSDDFKEPVDFDEYFEVIKQPMDLKKIGKMIDRGIITNFMELRDAYFLMCTNAIIFNPDTHLVNQEARQLKILCEEQITLYSKNKHTRQATKRASKSHSTESTFQKTSRRRT